LGETKNRMEKKTRKKDRKLKKLGKSGEMGGKVKEQLWSGGMEDQGEKKERSQKGKKEEQVLQNVVCRMTYMTRPEECLPQSSFQAGGKSKGTIHQNTKKGVGRSPVSGRKRGPTDERTVFGQGTGEEGGKKSGQKLKKTGREEKKSGDQK